VQPSQLRTPPFGKPITSGNLYMLRLVMEPARRAPVARPSAARDA